MNRRIFLSVGLAAVGLYRRAWAQLAGPPSAIRYASLTRPVKIPLTDVTNIWQPRPFVAEGTHANRRVLISGVVFRTEKSISALCVTCPHEQCQVDLVTEAERLSRMLGRPATHPLFECGCHFSVFDAANDGARISGESPRGLYRFRITDTREGVIEINEVEDVALSEV